MEIKALDYLLALLRSVLNNEKPPELPEGISFEEVFRVAKAHSVANTAFYAVERLEKKPAETLMSEWEQLRDMAVVKDINQLTELELISGVLSEKNIRHIPLKGSVLKELYPQSDMRTMADIDMLVDETNAADVRDIMRGLGYECEHFGYDIHDIYYKKPIMNVEIHRALFGEEGRQFGEVFASPFSLCERSDDMRAVFSDDYFLAYVIAHALKHYEEGGTGIRSFMDIAVYLRAKPVNTERVCEILEPSGCAETARDFIRLSRIWFEGEKGGEKYVKMAEYVLSGGTYGTIQNSVGNKVKSGGRAKYLFRLVFPTFWHMKQHYPILKKAPVLLPFCWLVRLVTKPFINREQNAAKLRALTKNDRK